MLELSDQTVEKRQHYQRRWRAEGPSRHALAARLARNWRLIGTLAARGENWLQEEFFTARHNQIFQKISGDSEFLISARKSPAAANFYSHN